MPGALSVVFCMRSVLSEKRFTVGGLYSLVVLLSSPETFSEDSVLK